MAVTKVRNDDVNQVLLVGVQTAQGTPATLTHRLTGKPDIDWMPEVTIQDESTGTYMTGISVVQGLPANTGSWGEAALSYERAPSYLRAICAAGGNPFSGSGPDYLYKQSLDLLNDNCDLLTVLFGTPGLLERYTDLRFSEINLAFDPDGGGSWTITPTAMIGKGELPTELEGTVAATSTTTSIKVTGGGMTPNALVGAWFFPHGDDNRAGARLITANDATTITLGSALPTVPTTGEKFVVGLLGPAGVPVIAEEKIKAAGTKVFIDPATGTIGTTQILQRVISGNITVGLNLDNKAFAENEYERSGVYGRGKVNVTGQLRLEFDRPDEIRQMRRMGQFKIRFQKEGSELSPGVRKLWQPDIPLAVWTDRTRDTRNNNLTQTMAFSGISPTLPIEFTTRNGLSVLPA